MYTFSYEGSNQMLHIKEALGNGTYRVLDSLPVPDMMVDDIVADIYKVTVFDRTELNRFIDMLFA